MSYGICPSAATLAGYILGRTRRVAVGTAVSVLSTQHPVAFAEQAALLDQVSGGRFWLGAGRGGPWVDLEVFGPGLDRYESGFAESLDLLLAALTRGRVRGTGPAFTFPEITVVPRPRTRPPAARGDVHVPGKAALAPDRSLPMLLGMHIGDDQKREMIACYETAAPPGRPRAGHIGAVVAQVAGTRREAQQMLRGQLPARSPPTAAFAHARAFFWWNSTAWRVNIAQSLTRASTAPCSTRSAERRGQARPSRTADPVPWPAPPARDRTR